jgi:RES domain-containing protein
VPQILDRVLTTYRIGDPSGSYPIFDVTGSQLYPGRWNTPASPMLYTSEHYATAMLEKLAHGSGMMPPNQHYIEITIPNGVSYEILDPAMLPGWDDPAGTVSKPYGETWKAQARSLLLIVPSVLARLERNILINLDHAESKRVSCSLHHPVIWDPRLYGPAVAPPTP